MLRSRESTSFSPSSYVPHYTLLKRHVLCHTHGPHRGCYELHIPFSKFNPGNNGDSVFLLPQPASSFCLVAAFDAYLPTIAHRPAAGPLFAVHPSVSLHETTSRPPCNATLLPVASLSLLRPPTPYAAVAVSPSQA